MFDDYIFVDRARIETYFEQMHAGKDMMHAQKVSTWELSATITSLGAKGHDSVNFREPTFTEKLNDVVLTIEKKYPNVRQPETYFPSNTPFHRVDMIASRAFISLEGLSNMDVKHLAVWLPQWPSKAMPVYLIEAPPDEDPKRGDVASGYSLLNFLVEGLSDKDGQLRKALLGPTQSYARPEIEEQFANDPIGYLARLGVRILPPRQIETVFRHRLQFIDFLRTPTTPAVIGYPLFITAK